MARSSATFAKRQKERARQEKQRAKMERRQQRKLNPLSSIDETVATDETVPAQENPESETSAIPQDNVHEESI